MAGRRNNRRPPAKFGRNDHVRDGLPRYLIVCEGECTEPYYLDAMRRSLNLPNVRIAGHECGSDPLSVVRYAIEKWDEDKAIDRIVCIIDRDEHATFAAALAEAEASAKSGTPIRAIVSYPSFEYWYLLHFTMSRQPVVRSGGRSPGDNMVRSLKAHLQSYQKADRTMWLTLRDRLDDAIANSKIALKQAEDDGNPNPSTSLHVLVTELLGMAR